MKFNYKKLVQDYRLWVDRETAGNPDFVPADVAEIRELLRTGSSEADCRLLGLNLSYVANWYGRRGVCLIAQGDPKGWSDLSASALNDFWNIRICCHTYDQLQNKFRVSFLASILDAGQCGILCTALNAWNEASWMAQRLQQSRSDGSISAWGWDLAVPRLVIALHRYAAGQKDVSDLELGVYKTIFDRWNDSAELQKALLYVADYHVENLKDKGAQRFGEFARPPVDIFPAELVAIQRVRERLGLETPAIDHPLMKTPFANPPKDLRPEPDELLTQVLKKVRTIIPDL